MLSTTSVIDFDVHNCHTGGLQFTAFIRCKPNASLAVKRGLALKWALANGVSIAHADLSGADISATEFIGADLSNAHLPGADLSYCFVERSNFSGAYLPNARLAGGFFNRSNFSGASLANTYMPRARFAECTFVGASLVGAYMSATKGIPRELTTPLLMLLDQPSKIRAYRLVVGADDVASNDDGITAGTLRWALSGWRPGCRVLIVEFGADDIDDMPANTEFVRLRRCAVVGEKVIDPTSLGLAQYGAPQS